jgi:KDO2-lipid IV(A) lauroyltransferase
MWLGIVGMRCIARLPLFMQQALGRLLGRLALGVMRERVRITECNLAHCLPELSAQERRTLVRRSFESNGMGLIESFRGWFQDPEQLRHCVTLHGLDNLYEAQARGRGVILLGGHFSTLDLSGSITTLFFVADIVQREHNNALFNHVMTGSRDRLYGSVLSKTDLKGMVRCLRQNHVVWFAVDQDNGRRHSVFAPFFGRPCASLTSPMRLARISGAAVVPFSHFRRPGAQGYDLFFQPALTDFPSGDDVADATRLNRILEQAIRTAPEQYLWMHRRFKTPQQPGTPNIYGQIRH